MCIRDSLYASVDTNTDSKEALLHHIRYHSLTADPLVSIDRNSAFSHTVVHSEVSSTLEGSVSPNWSGNHIITPANPVEVSSLIDINVSISSSSPSGDIVSTTPYPLIVTNSSPSIRTTTSLGNLVTGTATPESVSSTFTTPSITSSSPEDGLTSTAPQVEITSSYDSASISVSTSVSDSLTGIASQEEVSSTITNTSVTSSSPTDSLPYSEAGVHVTSSILAYVIDNPPTPYHE